MRLIDADELKRLGYALTRTYPKDPQTMVYETKNIDDIPTIDPVKHGRWSIVNIYTYATYNGTIYEPIYRCSACGMITESYVREDEPIMPEDADFPNYCSYCGAKMEE